MNKFIIFVGPSGCGKSAVMKELVKKGKAIRLPSITTRQERFGASESHYAFVSRMEFYQILKSDGLLEYTTYGDQLYGTKKDDTERALLKGHAVKALDVQGAKTMKKLYGERCFIVSIHRDYEAMVKSISARAISEADKKSRIDSILHEEIECDRCCDMVLENDGTISEVADRLIQAIGL